MNKEILSIDVGGTNTKLALIENSKIAFIKKFKTQKDRFKEFITEKINTYKSQNCKQAYIAAPGVWNQSRVLEESINLKELIGKEIWAEVEERSQVEIILNSDIDSACIAEARIGQANEYQNLIYINMGTGLCAAHYFNNYLNRNHELRLEAKNDRGFYQVVINSTDKFREMIINLDKKFKPEIFIFGGGKAIEKWNSLINKALQRTNIKFQKSKLEHAALYYPLALEID